MHARGTVIMIVAVASFLGSPVAYGLDQPIGAMRLNLKKTATKQSLLFVSKDPAFLFPSIGSADDPATGTPGGVLVELFSANEGTAALAVPSGAGWMVKTSAPPLYRFVNAAAPGGSSPVRGVMLKQGRLLRVQAKLAGLPLAGPQGAVGIRVTTGTLRSCALFTAATVKKDEAGRFVAMGALASALADCSDASLGDGTTTTTSTSTSTTTTQAGCAIIPDPLEPMCGGACPAGETCEAELNGQITPNCSCYPDDVTPCFGSGYPACGGFCTGGRVCQAFHLLPGETPELTSCACVDPLDPCDGAPGTCFGIGVCPPGEVCTGHGPPTSSCGCSATP